MTWFSPRNLKAMVISLLLITIGSVVFMVGVNAILIPKGFLNGGVVGVALILVYLFPTLKLGFVYALLNVPLFLLGWFHISRRFIVFSILGTLIFSATAELVRIPAFPIHEPILAAILAGLICGLGAGLVLRSQGSAGGVDILAVYLNKKLSLRFGMTTMLFNALVLIIGGILFNLEMALYTMIFVYIQSRVIDGVITGFNVRKSVMVISDEGEKIAERIMTELKRGVTYLEGAGAFTGHSKRIVFSIITLTELAAIKAMVFDIDPHAFVVVNDTLDVLGKRHGQLKVY